METTEECIIEIKKAIARIEEQLKTIFNRLNENRDAAKDLSSLCRDFDVRVTRHDVDIQAINKALGKMEVLMQEFAENASKVKGIALGLGMAGGAIVSILTIVAEIIK